MQCRHCECIRSKVVFSRTKQDTDGWTVIERQRRCENGHEFTTYECYEYADVEAYLKLRDILERTEAELRDLSKPVLVDI